MKKFLLLTSIIIGLLILHSCNSKEETAPNKTFPIPGSPVVETKQVNPQQKWKESLLSDKAIETEKDIEFIKQIIEKAVANNNLEELQTFLEAEIKKDKIPPQILFGLSLIYGRKGLVKEEYKTIEKLEETVKQAPKIAFNLSLVYGRKETLKSQIDKAEADALALLQGFISVSSTPEGAEVYLNGELKGTTPFTTEGIREGSYAVDIQKENYSVSHQTVNVMAGETTEIIEKLTLIPGTLVINSDPVGSTILLDGEKIGVTPFEIKEIISGSHKLILKKENYQDLSKDIIINPGKKEIFQVNLTAIFGSLYIPDFINGSVVYIDNIRKFPVNNRFNNLETGTHQIKIEKKGYLSKSESFYIQANKPTTISGILSFVIPYATIKIDGKEEDWNLIESTIIDNLSDNNNGPNGTDLHKIYLATDGTYLYTKINLADGKPSERPLYYAIGIETPDKSFSRLLFTQYNRTWTTGVDKWTTGNYHEQIAKGTIKSRNDIIEARYKLKDIGISVDQQLLINAWDDPSGKSYDNTSQVMVEWVNLIEISGIVNLPDYTTANKMNYSIFLDNNNLISDGYIKKISEKWNTNTSIEFTISDIPMGEYFIYSFIDTDNSGNIPGSGDYFGTYGSSGLLTPKTPNILIPSIKYSNVIINLNKIPTKHNWESTFTIRNAHGITHDGEYLWYVDRQNNKILKIDTSGKIISSINSPIKDSRGTGLTFDGQYLWFTNDSDQNLYKLSKNGNLIQDFDIKISNRIDSTGLAFDGTSIWNSGFEGYIYKIDRNGKYLEKIRSPGTGAEGLTYDGQNLWNIDYNTLKIYKLNMEGNIVLSFDTPAKEPLGLTFDGEYMWLFDSNDGKMYKININSDL